MFIYLKCTQGVYKLSKTSCAPCAALPHLFGFKLLFICIFCGFTFCLLGCFFSSWFLFVWLWFLWFLLNYLRGSSKLPIKWDNCMNFYFFMTTRVWLLSGLQKPTEMLRIFFKLDFNSTAFQPFKSVLEYKENHMWCLVLLKRKGGKRGQKVH